MATDGRDSGDPQEGVEFGWLYGKRPGGQEPPPDATRMMPVQPRPDGAPPAGARPPADPTAVRRTVAQPGRQPSGQPTPPPRPAPTPGRGPGGPGGPGRTGGGRFAGFWARRLRRPSWYVRTAMLLVLVWLVYTVAVPFVTWSSNDQVAYEPAAADRPAEQDGTTYLLVGSDSRAGLTAAERKKFTTGNPTSELTDTIMLLHTGSGPNVLLSVPRDSIVDMPGFGQAKINSAYSRGGPELLVQTLEGETGIRIDKYVEIGLGGVADVVDAVGGIEVCPRERIKDKFAGLNITKGCQEIDGTVALAYSRSRKFSQFGDLERVRRQREVVASIGDKVLSPWTVVNPIRWWKLNKAVPEFFTFGEGTSKLDASKWALAMSKVQLTCTMPVTDLSATQWDRTRADPLFKAIIEDRTGDIKKTQCTGNGIVK